MLTRSLGRIRSVGRQGPPHRIAATGLVVALAGASLLLAGLGPHVRAAAAAEEGGQVGLSLFFQNGQMAPFTLVGDAPRFLQEVDIVATAPPGTTDQGIQPLVTQTEFASLDWTGVRMVEEDWRPAGDGTFIRQRFYRGARWMAEASHFTVVPTDNAGNPVGDALTAQAGTDDRWSDADDGFVRRFVARQTAVGCPSVGDTTGATYIAQGLVQWRDALHPERRSQFIPASATRLRLTWNRDPGAARTASISHAAPEAFPFGYGFAPTMQLLNLPTRGYFMPGETVSLRLVLQDGQGNPLHPDSPLPSYGQFLRGEIASGIRYYDGFRLSPTLYYALKHREGNSLVSLSGPTDRLKVGVSTVDIAQFFAPQVTVTTTEADGYSSVAATIPPSPVVFGGLIFNPLIWETPTPDVVDLTLPADAQPGTYVATLKMRREFGGEALNRATTLSVPVGTALPTVFTARTGGCNSCHSGSSSLGNVLHGVSDRRACFSCHTPLSFEPDNPLDFRVHFVHDRSARFRSVADMRNCALCHLTTPGGPARGLLNQP